MRLNRFLAQTGVASRRECDRIIRQGRVSINGKVVREPGTQVDGEKDGVSLEGQVIIEPGPPVTILLNKPQGVLCTVRDDWDRSTVVDLVGRPERLFPIGRLDLDTEGVLLLTNDGDLAFRLTHPRFEVEKVYRVLLDREPEVKDLEIIRNGILLGDKKTAPCEADFKGGRNRVGCWVELHLHEGRKRQIKRMFAALGYGVLSLKRTVFAGLTGVGMATGEWRVLNAEEMDKLRKSVGL
ncbi:rRNA pseudouridine synthase [candidate division KSB1 bacterium]|nr:rRNA pseudouridine synthase [candidate division KSB1 bacterium]